MKSTQSFVFALLCYALLSCTSEDDPLQLAGSLDRLNMVGSDSLAKLVVVGTMIDENIGDDMHFLEDGFIYASDYGGTAIRKVNVADSTFEIILRPEVSTIGAIEVLDNLEIYVSSYDDGWVGSFNEDDAEIVIRYRGLAGPSGIQSDEEGNLFIATNASHSIMKVDTAGSVTALATGNELSWPTGITADDSGNLYTTNLLSGEVVKIGLDGSTKTLASLPRTGVNNYILGYLTWHNHKLYVCHVFDHVIYQIDDESGESFIIAGKEGNAGESDGVGHEATFHSPVGIVVSNDGNTLYVSDGELPKKKLRTIDISKIN